MTATLWHGWYRRSGSAPWERGVEADTLPECRRRLDAFLRENGIRLHSNLDACLTSGRVPDVPPRTPDNPLQHFFLDRTADCEKMAQDLLGARPAGQ
jgi:hypothetical protein